MSTGRARANHKLYLARIVIDAWNRALQAQDIPANLLTQAFLPAAREHLLDAYGWFLLELSNPGQWPEQPPHSCTELPALAEGKALAGEIREFQQLEAKGWLAGLLAPPQLAPRSSRGGGNLAAPAQEAQDPATLSLWAGHLERLFERMSDSLDEY